jgi:hypothetical protein
MLEETTAELHAHAMDLHRQLAEAEAKLERVRALAAELEDPNPPPWYESIFGFRLAVARRLLECLGEKA